MKIFEKKKKNLIMSKFWCNEPINNNENDKIKQIENDGIILSKNDLFNHHKESFYKLNNVNLCYDFIDINNIKDLHDLYTFLSLNYVQDHKFRFIYSKNFLKWSLTCNNLKDNLVIIKDKKKIKLLVL